MTVKPKPDGYHNVTPYLVVKGAVEAIEFYKKAFDAKEIMRMPMGDKIGHAQLMIGDSMIMLTDENPNWQAMGPTSTGSPMSIYLFVPDVDATCKKAIAGGAAMKMPIDNRFYGDRVGVVTDPFGYQWSIATRIEDVSQEDMKKRLAAMGQH